MKAIVIDPEKCTGCRLCELACSLKHTGEFNPSRSSIRVMGFDEVFALPVMCFHCEKPYCAEVCPASAIKKDEKTGTVTVAKEKCSGCKMCTLACPFGNISFSSVEKVAVKCDLCDGSPECVSMCPTGALQFKEVDNAALAKKRALSEKLKAVYEGVK